VYCQGADPEGEGSSGKIGGRFRPRRKVPRASEFAIHLVSIQYLAFLSFLFSTLSALSFYFLFLPVSLYHAFLLSGFSISNTFTLSSFFPLCFFVSFSFSTITVVSSKYTAVKVKISLGFSVKIGNSEPSTKMQLAFSYSAFQLQKTIMI
jgi:hypothetical protein